MVKLFPCDVAAVRSVALVPNSIPPCGTTAEQSKTEQVFRLGFIVDGEGRIMPEFEKMGQLAVSSWRLVRWRLLEGVSRPHHGATPNRGAAHCLILVGLLTRNS